jgi:hypothetical protein
MRATIAEMEGDCVEGEAVDGEHNGSIGGTRRSGGSADAFQLLSAVVAAVEADLDVDVLIDLHGDESGLDSSVAATGPVLDVRGEVAIIDLREGRPADPDTALAVILNRARYKARGTAAVSPVGHGTGALAELATLADRTQEPDVMNLVRQAAAGRSAAAAAQDSSESTDASPVR